MSSYLESPLASGTCTEHINSQMLDLASQKQLSDQDCVLGYQKQHLGNGLLSIGDQRQAGREEQVVVVVCLFQLMQAGVAYFLVPIVTLKDPMK